MLPAPSRTGQIVRLICLRRTGLDGIVWTRLVGRWEAENSISYPAPRPAFLGQAAALLVGAWRGFMRDCTVYETGPGRRRLLLGPP